uniref:Profilin n=1 Tax=Panagrolaimus sp. JU765 TaxID=591449 RepID=A0AC34R4D9_9BILA
MCFHRSNQLIMSGWQAYITTLFDGCQGIKRAAIVGLDGSVWARSEGANEFRGTEAELKTFVNHFSNINDVPSKGADLEGIHYIVPRTEENLIFGKKDKSGFFAVKTKTAVIIAVFEGESSDCAEARSCVEKLAQYLATSGY